MTPEERIQELTIRNLELQIARTEAHLRPSNIYLPDLVANYVGLPRNNILKNWSAIFLGDNNTTIVAGWGNTPEEAMLAFDIAWNRPDGRYSYKGTQE